MFTNTNKKYKIKMKGNVKGKREKNKIGRTKEFSCREFEQILKQNGFKFHHQKGDHLIYKRNSEAIVITKKLNRMVARRLLKEYHLKF